MVDSTPPMSRPFPPALQRLRLQWAAGGYPIRFGGRYRYPVPPIGIRDRDACGTTGSTESPIAALTATRATLRSSLGLLVPDRWAAEHPDRRLVLNR